MQQFLSFVINSVDSTQMQACMWISMSYCVRALRYADVLVSVVAQGFRDKIVHKSNCVSGVTQLIWADNAHETVRSMVCAKLLCDLSFVAYTIQEQVSLAVCAHPHCVKQDDNQHMTCTTYCSLQMRTRPDLV